MPPLDDTPRITVAPTHATVALQSPSPSREAAEEQTILIPDDSAKKSVSTDSDSEDVHSQYAIRDKIGDGGMGVVYLARDRRLGRFVAVKRLNAQTQHLPSLRRRFLQEARAVAALNHIHIVHVYSLGEDKEGPYIVMEYVPGPDDQTDAGSRPTDMPTPPLSLDRKVLRQGALPVSEAVALMVKISRAIAYAHSCGVIHRDLKPSNVLLDKSGEPKIVDFGLARLMHDEESKLTVPGEKLLSLGYGAPEQESDASMSDERADVYGLGALLFFAITAQNPRYFREQDLPLVLREPLQKALATDRDKRWATALDFTEALMAILNRTKVETPTVKTTWRCKWCDTINPLSIRYCAECGWDGGEQCLECNAETHVGVRFCGNCGADAREYEAVHVLLATMNRAYDACQFERVLSNAGRALGFEPAGPTGRRTLQRLQDSREKAEQAMARRERLKEQIPLEMRAENFERAGAFVQQFRDLSEDKAAFKDEQKRIPEAIRHRDLMRAQNAMRNQEWPYAARIARELLDSVTPGDADCLAILTRVRRHKWIKRIQVGLTALMAVIVLYLFSVAPVARYTQLHETRVGQALYTPGVLTYHHSPLARPLQYYSSLWGVDDVRGLFFPQPDRSEDPRSANIAGLDSLTQAYNQALVEMKREQARYLIVWPQDYNRALEALMERRRLAGDFEGWDHVNTELTQFQASDEIGPAILGEHPDLTALKTQYAGLLRTHIIDGHRRLLSTTKKHVNDLTDLQRKFTKADQMDSASAINAEMKRVESRSDVLAARAAIAAQLSDEHALEPGLPLGDDTEELAGLRERYGEQLTAIENDFMAVVDDWPDLYTDALARLKETRMQDGDFEGWETANSELARFEVDQTLNPEGISLLSPELATLQREYMAILDGHALARAREVVKLVDRQDKHLNTLMKRYMRDRQIEKAANVNAELKRILNSAEYLSAQDQLRAAEVLNTPSDHPVPEAALKPDESAAAAP